MGVSAASDILTPNQFIKDGEYLPSSNGFFKLGFFSTTLGDSIPRRYVGIQFVESGDEVVVWVANRENPIYDQSGIFTFGKNGNLVILDGTNESIWTAASTASELYINESHAQLLYSGNLVLREGTTSPGYGRIIWESFNHPSHALLPGMKIGINLHTRETKVLRSWTSQDDPTPGDFTFGIDPQHLDQFFVWRRSIPYWRSFYRNGTTAKLVRPYMDNVYEELINFSIIKEKEEVYFTYSLLEKSNSILMLDPYGRLYFTELSQRLTRIPLSADLKSCSDVIQQCGVFSSCNHKNTVLCKCLPGFEPLSPKEWNAKDWKGGCRRRSELECGTTQDGFMPLRMKFSGASMDSTYGNSLEDCKELCVRDCNCNAFSYNQSTFTCGLWKGEIRELSESWDEDEVMDFYLRLASSDLQNMTRMCPNCGTNIIPYPLSTSPFCGDPAYMRFHCDNATGQLRFRAPDDSSYAVINMDKDGRTFVIQLEPLCWPTSTWFESKGIQLLNQSSPFHLTKNNTLMLINCSTLPTSSSLTCTSYNMCGRYIQEGGAPCFNVGKCCSYTVPDLSTSHSFNLSNTKCNGYMSIINANLSLPTASWLEGLEIGWDVPKEPICDSPVACIYADGKRTSLTLIPITIVMGSVLLGTFLYFFRRMVKRGNQNKTLSVEPLFRLIEDGKSDVEVPFYDFDIVSMATNEFSDLNKLGQGGFGAVYKGKLRTGQEIAVKRLSRSSGQGVKEFTNEVILISKLQHRNLVRLMGYCIDRDGKILLYEYMPNKSLDFFLFDKDRCQSLDWTKRITIILGIARGLLYLHQDSRMRIIHRDLKTSNILLDEELNPKISDFGLARIFGGKQIEENTNRVVGTYGYISPEYASHGIFSMKSDVFSFGVILVEIITGLKNTTFFHFQDSFTLLGHAWQLWMEEKALDLVDPSIRETCDTQEVLKCLQVGLLCVQEDPGDRPNMANVVAFFVSQTTSLPTPKKPAFFIQSNLSTYFSHGSSGKNCCRNEITMSSMVGR